MWESISWQWLAGFAFMAGLGVFLWRFARLFSNGVKFGAVATAALAGALALASQSADPRWFGVAVLWIVLTIFGGGAYLMVEHFVRAARDPQGTFWRPAPGRGWHAVALLAAAVGAGYIVERFDILHRVRETVGYVEFQPGGGYAYDTGDTVRLNLPPGWLVRYNGKQPWREATLFDETGRPRFELTVNTSSAGQYAPADNPLEGYLKVRSDGLRWMGGDPVCERRTTARGEMGVCRAVVPHRQGESIFIMAPRDQRGRDHPSKASLEFVETWNGKIVSFTFHTLPEQLDSDQEIAWASVADAAYSAPRAT
jgi:hypothetical protein